MRQPPISSNELVPFSFPVKFMEKNIVYTSELLLTIFERFEDNFYVPEGVQGSLWLQKSIHVILDRVWRAPGPAARINTQPITPIQRQSVIQSFRGKAINIAQRFVWDRLSEIHTYVATNIKPKNGK